MCASSSVTSSMSVNRFSRHSSTQVYLARHLALQRLSINTHEATVITTVGKASARAASPGKWSPTAGLIRLPSGGWWARSALQKAVPLGIQYVLRGHVSAVAVVVGT
jgi:hypothetical protein